MTPGTHRGIPMSQYLALDAFSASRAHTLLTYSPFHALQTTSAPSEVSEIGIAIHDALLEGVDRIASLPFDDYRKKDARAARDEARAEGRIPILERKAGQVLTAVESAKAFVASSEIAGAFNTGAPEVTLVWKEGALLCKARPDWLNDDRGLMIHVKTTAGSAHPESWIRNQLGPCGYDLAAAWYERGLRAAVETKSPFLTAAVQSVFLVIEQNPPYGCSLVALAPAMMDIAERKVARAIATWAECKRTGNYPSYPTLICYAEPKPWQLAEAEEVEYPAVDESAFTEEQLKGGIPL